MNAFILVILILGYSICLTHITLFAGIYIKHKNKIELYYLIVLSNIFLLAVIVMLLFVFSMNYVIPILVNILFSLYITVPLYSYNLFDVDKKYYKNIPILVIIEAVIENILLAHNILGALYVLKIIFFVLLTIPIFIAKKEFEKYSLEWSMQKATKIVIVIFIPFTILFVPLSPLIFKISYVSSLFWAVSTLFFQIPGLVYCRQYLLNKYINVTKTGLLSLTKRENEVALEICNGLKYEEIADKLFVTLSAIKKHTYSIYRKLGIKNNRELLHIFMEAEKMSPK
ncbi:helix-turn-helix domain-containing protein [Treponema sp. R6D11]